MNRQERKRMEKNLGIHKSQRKLTRKERFELMEKNIEAGRKKQEEMKEYLRQQEQRQKDALIQNQVSSRATEYMVKEGLDYSTAYEKAKKDFSEA